MIMRRAISIFGRSLLLTAAFVLVGVLFNLLRPGDGIALVAPRPYDIYVPCPETLVEALPASADEATKEADAVYVDARPIADYQREHIKGAISFPYPLLGDPPPEKVAELKGLGRPIFTYGDGGRGNLGELMASMLSDLGVSDVSHLVGGLPAWKEHGGATEGEAEQGEDGSTP